MKHAQLQLPEGDVLIHAGDFSSRGRLHEITDFMAWFSDQPHRHKICIAGNHDFLADTNPAEFSGLVPSNVHYLNDSGVTIEGIRFWGSPITPWFFDWAFNRERGAVIRKHWDLIPEDTQVLITHGPPYRILDETARDARPVGCRDLLKRVDAIRPNIHVFGHIHEGYGQLERDGVRYINAAVLDVGYQLVNAPVVVDWSEG